MRFISDDFYGPKLDLNERLVKHPAATFFFRQGEDGLLIVDRARRPVSGSMVIAVRDGELRLERFRPGVEIELWGVVTYEIRPR